jgi:type IV secretion system protein VirB5
MNLRKIIVIGLLINFSMKSFAMLPVVDAGAIANLIKNFNQLKSQYELLQQTYQNAQHQLEQVKQLTNDAEGHYGFGNFLWRTRF